MNQGNIYLRKDGRWEGRIVTGRKDGKRQYRAFFGRTREEAAGKMAEYQKSIRSAVVQTAQFSVVWSSWYRSMEYRVKESTAANYRLKAYKHILPRFGSSEISVITPDDICSFIRDKQSDGLSGRYITDILILMKAVFKYAVRVYHIQNPMEGIIMPKKQKAEIRLLTADEQAKLEQYISENPNQTTLGIALTMATGLRIGELCALQWKDIDLEKRILTVSKTIQRVQCKSGRKKTKLIITDPKSETSRRMIPIPTFLIGFLRQFQGDPEQFLLSGTKHPVEPRTMQYRFAKILKNGKLPSVHFHALRHMFASKCIQLGFDVKALSEILGHSGVEITLNRYVHSSFERKTELMDRLKMAV